jgi:hypothetical protein
MFCNVAPFSPSALKTEVASSSKILIPSYGFVQHEIPRNEQASFRGHFLHLYSGGAVSNLGVTSAKPTEGFGDLSQSLQAIFKILSELGHGHLISSTFKSINYRTIQHCTLGFRDSSTVGCKLILSRVWVTIDGVWIV